MAPLEPVFHSPPGLNYGMAHVKLRVLWVDWKVTCGFQL